MFIFDHFRLILGCMIVKWHFMGINMFNTLYLDSEKVFNLMKSFFGKLL